MRPRARNAPTVRGDRQRVGRLLGQNSRAAKLFDVEVGTSEHGAATVQWTTSATWRDWSRLSEGCYVLRSNLVDWNAEDLWTAYIHLTDAETAFRIQKSDLQLRPIWHQKEARVQAHILVCFLAYVLWKTLARWCHAVGLGDEPRRVFTELQGIRLVDVVLPTRTGMELRKRCAAARPNTKPSSTNTRAQRTHAPRGGRRVVKTDPLFR